MNALDAAAARAAAARNLINELGGPNFFPSEWAAAESLFAQAEQERRTSTTAEAQQSAARYTSAAEAYEAMLENTVARYYENAANELTLAREAAINVGARVFAPEFLLEADNMVVSAEEKYQAGDYLAARDAAVDAFDMYSAIGAGVVAFRIREEIALAVADILPEVLWQADDAGLDAIAKWEEGDFSSAKDGAETALSMYSGLGFALQAYLLREEILDMAERLAPQAFAHAEDAGWEAIARWEEGDFHTAMHSAENALLLYSRAAASAERQRALELRANTAVELQYIRALDIYTRANMALQMHWNQDALALYPQARAMFKDAADIALQRRLAAEDALRRADQRLAESDEIARSVEAILQGGMQ